MIKLFRKRITVIVTLIASLAVIIPVIYLIHNSSSVLAAPSIKDPSLKVETVVTGLSSPTSMAFIDNNNILILEKGGLVRLVSNGVLQAKPVLQVSVDTVSERGLLGIAILNSTRTGTASANNNSLCFYTILNPKAEM